MAPRVRVAKRNHGSENDQDYKFSVDITASQSETFVNNDDNDGILLTMSGIFATPASNQIVPVVESKTGVRKEDSLGRRRPILRNDGFDKKLTNYLNRALTLAFSFPSGNPLHRSPLLSTPLLLPTLLLLLLPSSIAETCVVGCQCRQLRGGFYVDCTRASLTQVPERVDESVVGSFYRKRPGDCPGNDMWSLYGSHVTEDECRQRCDANEECQGYAMNTKGACYPKTASCEEPRADETTKGYYFYDRSDIPASVKFFVLNYNKITMLQREAFKGLSQLVEINMHSNSIQVLPSDGLLGLSSLRTLRLTSNKIGVISVGAFRGAPHLQTLHLEGNVLKALDGDDFDDLFDLMELFLQNNRIEEASAEAFADLTSLKTLDLSGNRLVALPHGIFANLRVLRKLDLSTNRLRTVGAGAFLGLDAVETLSLKDNRLYNVSVEEVKRMKKIEVFEFMGNRWHCDCDTVPLFRWTLTTFPRRVVEFECFSPPDVRGQFFGDGGLRESDVCFVKIPPGMPIAVIGGALGVCASAAIVYKFFLRGRIPGLGGSFKQMKGGARGIAYSTTSSIGGSLRGLRKLGPPNPNLSSKPPTIKDTTVHVKNVEDH